ncbi:MULTISPECIES: ArsR/SmtB family transcription factor [unclassified Saccharothrix]|uniref:ArsR/SmtB family transcription factor n=1 Tax=unclassified Saccharothrix TaxID=2593673 RepID=UPI00307E919D
MAVRISLAGVGLARVRFAYSPVFETVMAVDGLRVPGAHAVHLPWVSWARERAAAIPDLDVVLDLMAGRVKPAVLMPVPDVRMPDLEAELTGVPARVAEVVRTCHRVLVAPFWKRITAVLEADIAHRAAVLADRGAEAVFGDLHPEVSWAGGELVLYADLRADQPHRVDLSEAGLVLSPSVFCWPKAWAAVDPVGAGVVRYPARGVGTLWDEPAVAVGDELAALVGRTRAALLGLLSAPMSTAELASRLGVTAGAVSQHVGVLRAARLVTSRREGRNVLHMRTSRADALMD